jgi:uncharacterized protein (TIGR02246 family)
MGTATDLWHQYETLDSMGDLAGFASLFATDGVYVDSAGRLEGREAIRARAEMVHRAFPARLRPRWWWRTQGGL